MSPPPTMRRGTDRRPQRARTPSLEERRAPMTPQLALRVAMVGCFALAMFAVIFFRLWFLQVLSGDHYVAQARSNRVRTIATPAPRGQILDRSGALLVDSTPVPAVLVSPPDLPVPLTHEGVARPPARDEAVLVAEHHGRGGRRSAPRTSFLVWSNNGVRRSAGPGAAPPTT